MSTRTTDTSIGERRSEGSAASPAGEADAWEMVVGLEVHVELATDSKLFSASPNRFGDEPNTNIDPVTLGLPGALPVLNRQAVELAMRIGLALNCRIQPCSFHRKNYFYPDMPKAYQISQYDVPLNVDGHLDLPDGTRIGIERAHLEEDTGKSTHVGGAGGRIHGSDASLIDFNRAGVPLVEIVGRPDIRTSEQARQYVTELRAILVAVGASDAKMEEGSMRVDANVSVHSPGSALGTRCEIKNLNSVRSLGRAIDYEAGRQIDLIEAGEVVRQETRHWDETDGRTHTLRSKEDADDYRYFLEPDLVPLVPDEAWIEAIRADLPPLPAVRRATLAAATGAPVDGEAIGVVVERGQDGYVIAVAAAGGDAARALVHVKEAYADQGAAPHVPAADLAALTTLETSGALTATQAKQVLAELVAGGGGDAAAIADAKGFRALDTSTLESLVDDAIAANPGAWEKYRAGEDKAVGALVGAVMKASRGQADGGAVTAILRNRRG
jgi:aspartyl-tRNA(Asn)/glutamyl-tRNA(Gln) amidotransferase subunit B